MRTGEVVTIGLSAPLSSLDLLVAEFADLRRRLADLERIGSHIETVEGYDLADLDARYVNVTGDTMTGELVGTAGIFSGAIDAATAAISGTLTAGTLEGDLDWSYLQNVPDPVITLTGAVTGAGTMTNLGSVSIATTAGAASIPWSALTGIPDTVIDLAGDLTGSVTLTDLAAGPFTLNATIAANSVALGTDTTGNYTASVAGTANQISVAGAVGEGQAAVLSLPAAVILPGSLEVTTTSLLTGLVTATAGVTTPAQYTSSVATGTPPLVVASTTKVANLNADLLDDQTGSWYTDFANITNRTTPVIDLAGDLTGSVSITSLGNGPFTLNATIAANSVALGTDTTGNYTASVAGTANQISVAGAVGEGQAAVLSLPSAVILPGSLEVTTTLDVNGAATFDGSSIGTSSFVSKTTGWRVTSGGIADFRSIYTDELIAKELVVDQTAVYAGSLVVAKSGSTLTRAFTAPASGGTATLYLRDLSGRPDVRCFANGDSVVIRTVTDAGAGIVIADCVGVVSAYSDLAGGEQSYTFTRYTGVPGDGGAAAAGTVFPVDAAVADYGTEGFGSISITTLDSAGAPYLDVVLWEDSPASGNFSSMLRLGKLDGITGATDEYGMVAGDWANRLTTGAIRASTEGIEVYGEIRADGFYLYDGSTLVARFDPAVQGLRMFLDGAGYSDAQFVWASTATLAASTWWGPDLVSGTHQRPAILQQVNTVIPRSRITLQSGDPTLNDPGATLILDTGAAGASTAQITADTITFTGLVSTFDLGATDTTIARASAGDVSVEGNIIYRASGTDVAIADGGTGASTAAAAFSALKQAATDTATGVVELLTDAETETGTDTTRAMTAANATATFVKKSLFDANTIIYATTDNTPVALTVGASTFVGRKATGNIVAMSTTEATALIDAATATAAGKVELATDAEAETGTDTVRALTPANASATYIKKTFFAAKGDLLGASANDTPVIITVGTNGYSPMADSAQSSGIKWAQVQPLSTMLPPAAFDTIGVGTPAKNGAAPTAWFLDGTNEEALAVTLPNMADWGWTTYNIVVYWANATGGAGGVTWRTFLNNVAAGAATGVGTAQPLASGTAGGNGVLVKTTAVTGVAVGASGNFNTMRIGRFPSDASDTLAGDCYFFGVELVKAS